MQLRQTSPSQKTSLRVNGGVPVVRGHFPWEIGHLRLALTSIPAHMDCADILRFVIVTMPPWPGNDEAFPVAGYRPAAPRTL